MPYRAVLVDLDPDLRRGWARTETAFDNFSAAMPRTLNREEKRRSVRNSAAASERNRGQLRALKERVNARALDRNAGKCLEDSLLIRLLEGFPVAQGGLDSPVSGLQAQTSTAPSASGQAARRRYMASPEMPGTRKRFLVRPRDCEHGAASFHQTQQFDVLTSQPLRRCTLGFAILMAALIAR
jgi:hypothetical protein